VLESGGKNIMKRITSIVPVELLEKLEKCLRATGVPGMTVDEVRGFGEHANFFSRDLMRSNVRIEIYISESKLDSTIQAIVDFAQQEHTPAGILVIESVERMINLNDGTEILAKVD